MRPNRIHLYGIDPGSGKACDVYSACYDLGSGHVSEQPTYQQWNRTDLGRVIEKMLDQAKETSTATMLAIDVPVVIPQEFAPPYICDDSKHYPFNVEPFTIRPCECLLRSLPRVVDSSLINLQLVRQIGKLCGWKQPYSSSTNIPFRKLPSCEGISVMIFSEAPHQPLMKVFRSTLESAGKGNARITTTPVRIENLESSHLYLLESHPAVAMGFWTLDGCLGSMTKISKYKGSLKVTDDNSDNTDAKKKQKAKENKARIQANLIELAKHITTFAAETYALTLSPAITSNDQLDAFVSLLNLLDLLTDRGDWFGTAASGYFLVPRLKILDGHFFSDAWQKAENEATKAHQLSVVLVQIAADHNRPLSLADFIKLAFEAGYETKAKSFAAVIHAALKMLTQQGTFIEDTDGNHTLVRASQPSVDSIVLEPVRKEADKA